MAGTRNGGLKASANNKARYGEDFYKRIGKAGGKISKTGGFASDKIGPDGLSGRERASSMGVKGGSISRKSGPHKKISVATSEENVPSRFAPWKGLRKFLDF